MAPRPALSLAGFRTRMAKHGVRLDTRTQLLYDPVHLFINGAALGWPPGSSATLRQLANTRSLAARRTANMPPETARILYNWYRDGYLHANTA